MREIKNIKIIIGAIVLLTGLGISTGTLTGLFIYESDRYDELYIDYLELLNDFNELDNQYFILTGEHIELEGDYINLLDDYDILQTEYDNLQNIYNTLSNAYNYICDTIRQSILPVQFSIFAEAVRRYYMDLYMIDGMTDKEWYMGYTEFCRDIAIFNSHNYYYHYLFGIISDLFKDITSFQWNMGYMSGLIMNNIFYHWLPNWFGNGLSGIDNLTDINTVHQWCVDEIDYEWDSDITYYQGGSHSGNKTWDYPKFPVETAFRTMGDCEDQAMLDAAYLESCGFETAIALSHDPAHPTEGAFYHGHLLVHIEDPIAFNIAYPDGILWNLGGIDPYIGYTWCFLDPTWNVPFGFIPSWLDDYIGIGGITNDIMSIAICDIDGEIGENTGLTCVMPT